MNVLLVVFRTPKGVGRGRGAFKKAWYQIHCYIMHNTCIIIKYVGEKLDNFTKFLLT